jgi:outer membrane protein TolC
VTSSLRAIAQLRDLQPPGTPALAERGDDIASIARAAYREGALTLVELLDAERARADARASAATWAAELAVAQIELNRALGAPIDEGL